MRGRSAWPRSSRQVEAAAAAARAPRLEVAGVAIVDLDRAVDVERIAVTRVGVDDDGNPHAEDDPPRAIDLRVTIGNVPCKLGYEIVEVAEHSEVTARLEPYGFKFAAFKLMTFGLSNQGFEAALVQSLANLKTAVERSAGAVDER